MADLAVGKNGWGSSILQIVRKVVVFLVCDVYYSLLISPHRSCPGMLCLANSLYNLILNVDPPPPKKIGNCVGSQQNLKVNAI